MNTRAAASVFRAAARRTVFSRARVAPLLETFEQFSDRYVKFFQNAEDLFEVPARSNNCFAHDLVPSPEVITAAVQAARRVNCYATAVRVFEGVKEKVENKQQYQAYCISLKEELYSS
ncbi:cytochrome-c oxidase chain VI [Coprinopsis sp. MPI-PUGE-AT-0042]|nr:cytochrome-c oxidase chain VI [Coprinopsis sp. MPI-PUGE-AT-0042]